VSRRAVEDSLGRIRTDHGVVIFVYDRKAPLLKRMLAQTNADQMDEFGYCISPAAANAIP